MSQSFEFTAVGFRFRNRNPTELLNAAPANVRLMPEPTNQFDPQAIAVYVAGTHVAYIARDGNQAAIFAHLQPVAGQIPEYKVTAHTMYKASVQCTVTFADAAVVAPVAVVAPPATTATVADVADVAHSSAVPVSSCGSI